MTFLIIFICAVRKGFFLIDWRAEKMGGTSESLLPLTTTSLQFFSFFFYSTDLNRLPSIHLLLIYSIYSVQMQWLLRVAPDGAIVCSQKRMPFMFSPCTGNEFEVQLLKRAEKPQPIGDYCTFIHCLLKIIWLYSRAPARKGCFHFLVAK